MLGIEVDCTRVAGSLILVRNKSGRVEELIAALVDALEMGSITREGVLSCWAACIIPIPTFLESRAGFSWPTFVRGPRAIPGRVGSF